MVCSVSLLVVLCSPAFAESPQKQGVIFVKHTGRLPYSSCDETELKYYNEQNLTTAVGIPAGVPVTWQSAIRLTQMELKPYMNWTITKVNVAFYGESACESIDVRIYLYENGTSTHPGMTIVNDTTFTLDTTGVTTIPLHIAVPLSDHEEVWVAVEWYQQSQPGNYYAWMDTLSGPAVDGKGDWWFSGSQWYEMQGNGPDFDGNWGIGAIVEGDGFAELSIGNIHGPLGIKADVSNIGDIDARNIQWSIQAMGGLLKRVNVSATGTSISLVAGSSINIIVGIFFGFGRINIMITAEAENALDASVTKTAFVLGPFVLAVK